MAKKIAKDYYLMHKDIPVARLELTDDGQLDKLHLDEIKTHSFIEKEIRLLTYVKDRNAVDLDKVNIDFSIYEKDMYERKIRAPKLKELFEKKLLRLDAFQHGKDIWKRAYPQ